MGRSYPNKNKTEGNPDLNGEERRVNIAYRFVGGPEWAKGAKFVTDFAEIANNPGGFLVSLFKGKSEKMPTPTYHWCVQVGGFYHQLQATGKPLRNWYENDHFNKEGGSWETFEVGKTMYNDAAINSAGIQAIESMIEEYDFWDNNCQKFTILLADLICRDGRKKVATSWSRGSLLAGFAPGMEEADRSDNKEKEIEVSFVENPSKHFAMKEKIEDIMQRETPEVTGEQLIQEVVAGAKEDSKTEEANGTKVQEVESS